MSVTDVRTMIAAAALIALCGCDLPTAKETKKETQIGYAANFTDDDKLIYVSFFASHVVKREATIPTRETQKDFISIKEVRTLDPATRENSKLFDLYRSPDGLNNSSSAGDTEIFVARLKNGNAVIVSYVFGDDGSKSYKLYQSDSLGNFTKKESISGVPIVLSVSPDQTKYAVSSRAAFSIFSSSGDLLKTSDKGGYLVWKNESEAWFFQSSNKKLVIYNTDTEAIVETSVTFRPQQYNPTKNELYALEGDAFFTLNAQTFVETKDDLDFLPLYDIDRHFPRISRDGEKILIGGQYDQEDGQLLTWHLVNRVERTTQVVIPNVITDTKL